MVGCEKRAAGGKARKKKRHARRKRRAQRARYWGRCVAARGEGPVRVAPKAGMLRGARVAGGARRAARRGARGAPRRGPSGGRIIYARTVHFGSSMNPEKPGTWHVPDRTRNVRNASGHATVARICCSDSGGSLIASHEMNAARSANADCTLRIGPRCSLEGPRCSLDAEWVNHSRKPHALKPPLRVPGVE